MQDPKKLEDLTGLTDLMQSASAFSMDTDDENEDFEGTEGDNFVEL